MSVITSKTVEFNKGQTVQSRNTPAATITASWIREDTEVGPSIASANHTCNGNCADFAIAAKKKARPAKVNQAVFLSLGSRASVGLNNTDRSKVPQLA